MGKIKRSTAVPFLLFIAPALFLYIVFIGIPSVQSLIYSFYTWDGISPKKTWVGLHNYLYLIMQDSFFHTAFINNLIWMVFSMTIPIILALAFAIVLNRNFRGRVIFRSMLYFPCLLSTVIVALVWGWIYNPDLGLLNQVLGSIGLQSLQTSWLADPRTALLSVFLACVWQSMGSTMIMFLAGLQGIPTDQYDAARVDGANGIKTFFHITIPNLKETFIIVFSLQFMGSFKVYDIIFAMTRGGPADYTEVLSMWMFHQTFEVGNVGMGSAIAWIMVIIVMLVLVPYVLFVSKRSEN